MKLIVGLGNPGKQYERTWHNLGFLALDELADSFSFQKKFHALVAEKVICDQHVLFAKPQTFMNNSGRSVRALAAFYKIRKDDIWVIHDDKDLALCKLKISKNSRSGGHKGVQSIIDHLQSQSFARFRMGTATEAAKKMDTEKYVLQRIPLTQKPRVKKFISHVAEALEYAVEHEIEKAMTKFNGKRLVLL